VATGGVLLADVQAGRGRLLPVTSRYSLARMYAPLDCVEVDVEGTFTFELANVVTPGVGLYVRHNGGFLDQTAPTGEGYVTFVQAFGPATGISLWQEVDGQEINLAPYTPIPIAVDTVYAVRLRVTQLDAVTTRLRTRVWPAAQAEPVAWDVDLTDDAPSLQQIGGGIAIDAWSQQIAGIPADVFVDDIVIGPVP
jgi:hypothetical protein